MKLTFLLASSLLTAVTAITLSERNLVSPRVVGLGIERNPLADPLANHRSRSLRRRGTVSQTLDNDKTLYFANMTIGTPAQSIRLHIDTGSSDLWVNTANSTLCQTQEQCDGGTYSPTSSTTYQYVNSQFNISYVDGTGSAGDYVKDTVRIGGETLTDLQFGLGFTSTSFEGVLGIGYMLNEVQVHYTTLGPYPNLPQAMVNAGLIQSNAYSLWLNDLDASTGTILFGGLNYDKYHGELTTLPIIQEYGYYLEFVIAMTEVAISGSAISSSSLPVAVLLDSGATLSYLPDDIATTIFNSVNAVYDSSSEAAYVPCSLKDEAETIDFGFSGQTISVPYNELVIHTTNTDGTTLTFNNGVEACLFGIAPASSDTLVLGDTFLRSAYVVYDLDNNEISLAATNFNSTTDDIREIEKGSEGLPSATAIKTADTSVTATTGGAVLGGATQTGTGISASATSTNAAERGADLPAWSVTALVVVGLIFSLL